MYDDIASSVIQYIESAMSELSSAQIDDLDGKYYTAAKKLEKQKVDKTLIMSCIADMMYEDKDIIRDIAGDQIVDQASLHMPKGVENPKEIKLIMMINIAESIKECRKGHQPMVEAMTELINQWRELKK